MTRPFWKAIGRVLGAVTDRGGVTKTVTPSATDDRGAEIDRAIAERRAKRERQSLAHELAWATRRAQQLRRDPILPYRQHYTGGTR